MGVWRVSNVTQVTTFTPMLDTVSITNQQPCELATAVFSAVAEAADEGDEIKFEFADDNSSYVTVFAGDVSVKTLTQFEGNHAFFEYQCRDYTHRGDDTILTGAGANRPSEDADVRLAWLAAFTPTQSITDGAASYAGTTLGAYDYTGMSKTEAYAQIAGTLGAVTYVDFSKVRQFYDAATVVASAFDLSTSPNNSTTFSYRDFHLDRDVTDADIDAVFVQGDGVTAWVPAAPTTGQRARSIQASGTTNLTDLTSLGTTELDRIGDPLLHGSLVEFKAGLNAGETVTITDSAHADLSGGVDFIINSTTVTPFPPSAANTRWGYRCEVQFSDRLACIPAKDLSRQTTTTTDCTDCTRAVAILPSGMAANLSLAEGRDGMFVFDGTTLAKYGCDMTMRASATPASHDLDYIDHEPVYEAVLNGDAALYTGTVGPFGDDRWSNGSETVLAARVMDIRKAWSVETSADPWIVTLGSGAPTLECDGADVVYTSNGAGIDTASMKHAGPGPWSDEDFDLYIEGIEFSAVHNNVQFLWYYGSNEAAECSLVYSVGAWSLDVLGDSTNDSDAPSLSTGTDYTIRWQHNATVSRAKIWASSGGEPGAWNVTRDPTADLAPSDDYFFQYFNNTTASVVQRVTALTFNAVLYDGFNRTTTSPDVGAPDGGGGTGVLRRRDMTDGSLEASTSISNITYDMRPTPNRQHVMLIEWASTDGPFQRYSRAPAAEGSPVNVTGWETDLADWCVDDVYTFYKITTDGVVSRYDVDGTFLWDRDLNADYGYQWPTGYIAFGYAYGNQTIIVNNGILYVAGYIGSADWTDGSQAVVLKLDPEFGELLDTKTWDTTGGNAAAQATAMESRGPCLWVGGVADGTDFEGQTISGVTGWLAKVPA